MIEEFTEKVIMLMQLHYSRLSEKDRKQYAALESLKLGRGGTIFIYNWNAMATVFFCLHFC